MPGGDSIAANASAGATNLTVNVYRKSMAKNYQAAPRGTAYGARVKC